MLAELSGADERKKQTNSKSHQELLDLQDQLQAANQLISQLQRENVELKVQVKRFIAFQDLLTFFHKPSF